MTIVWLVEHREETEDGRLEDCTVMHVASTRDLAEAWIKEHPDVSDKPYHWWIGREEVDCQNVAFDHEWQTYNPDGTPRSEEDFPWK